LWCRIVGTSKVSWRKESPDLAELDHRHGNEEVKQHTCGRTILCVG
jgi:hypothetical protein